MSAPAALYEARTFEEFWAWYARMHARPATQRAHAVGTLSCLALVVAGAWLRAPALVMLGPLVDYAIAQASHRAFEQNRTTPWRRQTWHTRAELRMLRLVLSGRMAREVERASAGTRETRSPPSINKWSLGP